MRWRLIVVGFLLVPIAFVLLFCAGVVRLPRPMFHNDFSAGERLWPHWEPPHPCRDECGHWAWADYEDNLLVVQATGVAETGRSKPLAAGVKQARFRLGSAWEDERSNTHVIIPRMHDALVVILPDGRWQRFSLAPGFAKDFHREWVTELASNLLRDAAGLLDGEERMRLDEFLKEYQEPAKAADGADRSAP